MSIQDVSINRWSASLVKAKPAQKTVVAFINSARKIEHKKSNS